MKLRFLTLNSIIDATYQCGMDNRPVFIYIAANPGSGKTWAAKSIEKTTNVSYYDGAFSPNEYRKHICDIAAGTRLFIHDDIGLSSAWNMKEFVSSWIMIIKGKMNYKHFRTCIPCKCNFSVVFISTLDIFYEFKDVMASQGFLDRVLLLELGLSQESREKYQISAQKATDDGYGIRDPPQRIPVLREKHAPSDLRPDNIDPRDMTNLLNISMYLEFEETRELINVVKSDSPEYEI